MGWLTRNWNVMSRFSRKSQSNHICIFHFSVKFGPLYIAQTYPTSMNSVCCSKLPELKFHQTTESNQIARTQLPSNDWVTSDCHNPVSIKQLSHIRLPDTESIYCYVYHNIYITLTAALIRCVWKNEKAPNYLLFEQTCNVSSPWKCISTY